MFHKLWIRILCFYSLLFIAHCKIAVKKNKSTDNGTYKAPKTEESIKTSVKKALRSDDERADNEGFEGCWITLDAKKHFQTMEELESSYQKTRERYPVEVANETAKFDNDTIELMLATRARREGKGAIYEEIPAGLNLGGYCMMRLPKSLLFFHRMKLRNITRFIIYSLLTDFGNMTISAELNLRDLHLLGSYERAIENEDPTDLKYVPTYGLAEILLKNVKYSIQGRLRFLHDSPYIVLVSSTLSFDRALLMYRNNGNATECDKSIELVYDNIEEFIDRMKADLDSWLRDFFNHLLIFFKPTVTELSVEYREYQKKRMIIFNEYVENAIFFLKRRLHEVNATVVRLPNFNIDAINGLEIYLQDGLLRGLDTIYRRSIATGSHVGKLRTVDTVVGFSDLKVVYKYTINLGTETPPVYGQFILSADELTAQMYITLIKDSDTVDISFDSIKQTKEEILTVVGPANRLISNFKHLLEHHIISIMSNTLIHNIRLMWTLAKCEPTYIGFSYDDFLNGPMAASGAGDYVINKEDSVELELNPKNKGLAGKFHMKLQESLRIKKLN